MSKEEFKRIVTEMLNTQGISMKNNAVVVKYVQLLYKLSNCLHKDLSLSDLEQIMIFDLQQINNKSLRIILDDYLEMLQLLEDRVLGSDDRTILYNEYSLLLNAIGYIEHPEDNHYKQYFSNFIGRDGKLVVDKVIFAKNRLSCKIKFDNNFLQAACDELFKVKPHCAIIKNLDYWCLLLNYIYEKKSIQDIADIYGYEYSSVESNLYYFRLAGLLDKIDREFILSKSTKQYIKDNKLLA